jgi:hypothetical protein
LIIQLVDADPSKIFVRNASHFGGTKIPGLRPTGIGEEVAQKMLRSLTLSTLVLAGAAVTFGQLTEDTVRKSIPVQTATRFGLDVDFGSIQVDAGSSGTIEVEATFRGNPPSRREFDRMLKDFSLDFDRQGSGVFIRGTFKDGWVSSGGLGFFDHGFCRNGKCLEYSRWLRHVEFRLRVPAQLAADLHTHGGSISVGDLKSEVNARTSGGSLQFGHIDGPVNGETSGGSITLSRGQGRAILHTSGGFIRIEEVAGDVEAETSGGSISITRTTGRVIAHTSGGSIVIGHAANAVDASTSGGGITVDMASNAAFQVDASTSGGGVHSDFTVIGAVNDAGRSTLRGTVNGGGPLLHLRSSGGGIRIRKAD